MPGSTNGILVSIDPAFDRAVTADWLAAMARVALEEERIEGYEVSVVLTGDEQVREFNRRYAGEDKPTDVLAFSLREGEAFVSPDETDRLGEVIVSYETAVRQADEAGRPHEDELAHLLVHGVLHLLGYDHAEPYEGQRMRERERAILATAGYAAH